MIDNNKLSLLISIAKLYYLENMNQNEIANLLGVSRPLISKYLTEARSLGVVKIEINDMLPTLSEEDGLIDKIKKHYQLDNVCVIPSSSNKDLNDQMFVDYATDHLLTTYIDNSLIGLGWGSVIGAIINKIGSIEPRRKLLGEVIPLISNAPISYRNYHTNELVRMLAEATGLKAQYLFAPVICSTKTEKEIFLNTENVKGMFKLYNELDTIMIQIRNFPSVPDLATEARFDKKLHEKKAVGTILGYYYDIDGNFIESDIDFSIQIPVESIKNTKRVIGIINARVSSKAVIGAMKTGLFSEIIVSDAVIKDMI